MSHLLQRALCAAIIVLTIAAAAPAHAHAVLLSSVPAAGAVLAEPPDTIALTFNEPVGILATSLVTPDGQQQSLGEVAVSGAVVSLVLPEGLGDGTHVLSWRVASSDGHPVGGTTLFSIGSATATATPSGADPVLGTALWLVRALLYGAMAFGIGTTFVLAALRISAPSLTRFARATVVAGLVLAPVSLALHGADAVGLGFLGMVSPDAWSAAMGTSYAQTILVLFSGFAAAGVALALPAGPIRLPLAVLGVAAAPLALALSGHASAASPEWLTRPAVFLHGLGILFWIGALVPLVVLLRTRSAEADAALTRFSAIIPYPVAALLVSGVALAVVQLGPEPAPWLSPYGAILATKLVLLAVLFALALVNRLRLTRPALAGDGTARRQLRRSIALEIVVVALIFAVVAGWRFTPPPRALALIPPPAPVYLHAMNAEAMADIFVEPGIPGPNALRIFLVDSAGGPIMPLSVEISASLPALGIEPTVLEATLGDDDHWHAAPVLPLAGDWQIDLSIRLDRFTETRVSGVLTITEGDR